MNEKFDVILVSTCCNHESVYELIDSLINYNNLIVVCLIVVNQDENKIKFIQNTNHTKVDIIEYNRIVNTSVARNVGIQYLLDNNYISHFVCFPDDDSSFDFNFFCQIKENIRNCVFKNLVTDIYCTGTDKLFRKINLENNSKLTKKNFNIVGAVNIILNFPTFSKVLYFDTRFGVNAKYGAGEDGDYFIRAIQKEPFYYSNTIYTYHPSGFDKFRRLDYRQKRKKLKSYGFGVIALLCKHKMYFKSLVVAFRALGGVLNSFSKFEFSLGLAYFEAFFVRLFCLIKFLIFPIK